MVVMSSDGTAMAVAGERGSTVVSSADGRVLSAFDAAFGGSATAAAFQPGSRIVVLAGADGVGRMFDSDTGRLLKALDFEDNYVHGLAFTPDGRGLIIGSEARTTAVSRGLRPVGRPGVSLADRRDYAIMFATNDYEHWPDLVNPIPDAETLKGVLEKDYGFEVKIVSNPTREQVLSELRAAHERTFGPADQLLIFFSVLGGMSVFGLLGIVLGPVVLAITLGLLDTFKQDKDERSVRKEKSPLVTLSRIKRV